jgi:hypothetical protein
MPPAVLPAQPEKAPAKRWVERLGQAGIAQGAYLYTNRNLPGPRPAALALFFFALIDRLIGGR